MKSANAMFAVPQGPGCPSPAGRVLRGARRVRVQLWGLALCLAATGCGPTVGECDVDELNSDIQDLNDDTPGYHKGQQVVQAACGTCHGANATGAARQGAPAELDFNTFYTLEELTSDNSPPERVLVARDNIIEWADAMWAEIEAGRMPPLGELSEADKAKARNWMACVADRQAPEPGPSVPQMVDSDNGLEQAMPGLIAAGCGGCHNSGSAQGGFALVDSATDADACFAYNAITARAGLITPGDAANSLLIGLLDGTRGSTNTNQSMPPGAPLMGSDPVTYQHMVDWVAAGAPRPLTCTP